MDASRVYRILGAALVTALATLSAHSQSTGWRDLRIDGSSLASLEASVASLQNALPPDRREEFEIALAVIWTRHTLGAGDLDQDGDVDLDDGQSLKESTAALLTDIQRGNLYAAIAERSEHAHQYTATDYLEELDGLIYDDVLRLAGEPSAVLPGAELKPSGACRDRRTRGGECEEQIITVPVAKTFHEAMRALSAGDLTRARAAIDELNFDAVSGYERSKVEQILFSIAYGEGEYLEAREHAQSAIEAGGLNEQEVTEALGWIRNIDSWLAAAPSPEAEPRGPTGGP
jgi:hypothetical protein